MLAPQPLSITSESNFHHRVASYVISGLIAWPDALYLVEFEIRMCLDTFDLLPAYIEQLVSICTLAQRTLRT